MKDDEEEKRKTELEELRSRSEHEALMSQELEKYKLSSRKQAQLMTSRLGSSGPVTSTETKGLEYLMEIRKQESRKRIADQERKNSQMSTKSEPLNENYSGKTYQDSFRGNHYLNPYIQNVPSQQSTRLKGTCNTPKYPFVLPITSQPTFSTLQTCPTYPTSGTHRTSLTSEIRPTFPTSGTKSTSPTSEIHPTSPISPTIHTSLTPEIRSTSPTRRIHHTSPTSDKHPTSPT